MAPRKKPEAVEKAIAETLAKAEASPTVDVRDSLVELRPCPVCGTRVAVGWPCSVDGHQAEE